VRSRAGSRGEHAHGVVDALGQGEPAGEGGVPQASQLLLGPVRGSGTGGKIVDVALEIWAIFVVTSIAGSFASFLTSGDSS
jgi:hypothetical protein